MFSKQNLPSGQAVHRPPPVSSILSPLEKQTHPLVLLIGQHLLLPPPPNVLSSGQRSSASLWMA